jgi:hypothetical protein
MICPFLMSIETTYLTVSAGIANPTPADAPLHCTRVEICVSPVKSTSQHHSFLHISPWRVDCSRHTYHSS